MRVVLLGYGNVGKAFAQLLKEKRSVYPFPIVGIHTANHGSVFDFRGLDLNPPFGPRAASADEFLAQAKPDVAVEITTLNPASGEPAISHIRSAFLRKVHVITANKGPIAHAYDELREEARRAQVEFRFESAVMDGAPVFNMVRNNLPGVRVLGFTGVLNSTSKIVVAAMSRGSSMVEGIREAQALGVAEADAALDIDGWDSAAKTAALANVLMNARAKPQQVEREGLRAFTPGKLRELDLQGQTVMLVSRARYDQGALRLQVAPEILPKTDLLATAQGTSNVILLHTDLMGTIGTVSIDPGVRQTAYGLFSDLVDIARSV